MAFFKIDPTLAAMNVDLSAYGVNGGEFLFVQLVGGFSNGSSGYGNQDTFKASTISYGGSYFHMVNDYILPISPGDFALQVYNDDGSLSDNSDPNGDYGLVLTPIVAGVTATSHEWFYIGSTDGVAFSIPGGSLTVTDLTVGSSGTATLTVKSGANVTTMVGLTAGSGPGDVGTINIEAGGTVANYGAVTAVGSSPGSHGTITVSGPGARLESSYSSIVGYSGTGVATVSGGGVVNAGTLIAVGELNQSHGSLTIGAGSTVTGTSVVIVGDYAGSNGQISILAGGTLALTGTAETSFFTFNIGAQSARTDSGGNPIPAAQGAVTVSGAGALLDTGGNSLSIGGSTGGTGSLTIAQGGSVNASSADSSQISALSFANAANGVATVLVTDPGSRLTANGYVLVGRGGTASLDIENGATMVVNDSPVGGSGMGVGAGRTSGPSSLANIGGSATVSVTGGGLLNVNSKVSVMTVGGYGADGALNVAAGGTVLAGTGIIVGTATKANGTIYGGTGTVDIGAGGTVLITAPAQSSSFAFVVGTATSSVGGPTDAASGTVTVSGAGALLDTNGSALAIGYLSNGDMMVSQGGSVVAGTPDNAVRAALAIGRLGSGSLTVADAGTQFTVNGGAYVGRGGSGSLIVENSATMDVLLDGKGNGSLGIGTSSFTEGQPLVSGGSGSALVTTGGKLFSQTSITVGQGDSGALTVNNNGTVEALRNLRIGNTVTVPAGGLNITTAGTTTLAAATPFAGSGTVSVGVGGLLKIDNAVTAGTPDITIGAGAGSSGVLIVSGTSAVVDSTNGSILIGGAGTGLMHASASGIVNAGTGTVDIGNLGTVIVDSSATLVAGALNVGGSFGSGTLSVASGGDIAAAAINISGPVLLQGGTLAPNGAQIAINAGQSLVGYGMLGGSASSIINTGTVEVSNEASPGPVKLLVTGSTIDGAGGMLQIDGGATLELDLLVGNSQTIRFASSTSPETLMLDLPQVTNGFTIDNWQIGDALAFNSGINVIGGTFSASGTLSVFTSGGTYDFTHVNLAPGAAPNFAVSGNALELTAQCFRKGTNIATPNGSTLVQHLSVGDRVLTLQGESYGIIWIGHRHIDCTRHPEPQKVWPVRVAAEAFGPRSPRADLWLSPDHAIYMNDAMIPVKHLINGTSIVQVPIDEVTYYHIELPHHDVLLAEGAPVESYFDVGDRSSFANGNGVMRLFPDFSGPSPDVAALWEAKAYAPLLVAGPEIELVRRFLAERAVRDDQPDAA